MWVFGECSKSGRVLHSVIVHSGLGSISLKLGRIIGNEYCKNFFIMTTDEQFRNTS